MSLLTNANAQTIDSFKDEESFVLAKADLILPALGIFVDVSYIILTLNI